jgi:hypothetical protein
MTAPNRVLSIPDWASAMAGTVGRSFSLPAPYTGELLARRVLHDNENVRTPVFGWTPDGDGCFFESEPGVLVRRDDGTDVPVWSARLSSWQLAACRDLAVSQDGTLVALADAAGAGLVLDARTGRLVDRLPGLSSGFAFNPTGGLHLATPDTHGGISIVDRRDGDQSEFFPHSLPIHGVAWSPAGDMLAAATTGQLSMWRRTSGWRRDASLPSADRGATYARACWSPDGRYVAAAPAPGASSAARWPVTVWLAGAVHRRLGLSGGSIDAATLAWTPESAGLAFAGEFGHIELWDVQSQRRLMTIANADRRRPDAWMTRWHPTDGSRLAVSYAGGTIMEYQLAMTDTPRTTPTRVPLPAPADVLAGLGAAAGSAGLGVPLSVLAELLTESGAAGSVCHGARTLGELGWPAQARIGMALLVAAHLPAGGGAAGSIRAPADAHRAQLHDRLLEALRGHSIEPVHGQQTRRSDMDDAFAVVADRYVGLLTALGPQAVAAEPALPLRLMAYAGLPTLRPQQRQTLSVQLGTPEGNLAHGAGQQLSGISRRGAIGRLLNSQLALDDDVFTARFLSDQLLYRVSRTREPAGARPLIVVLDDTPAVAGNLGITLRTAAHLLISSQLGLGHQVPLVRLASPARIDMLTRPADLVRLWAAWSVRPPALQHAVDLVRSLTAELSDGVGAAPRTVVFTHPFLRWPAGPDVRLVRVGYPGWRGNDLPPGEHALAGDAEGEQVREVLRQVLLAR